MINNPPEVEDEGTGANLGSTLVRWPCNAGPDHMDPER